MALILAVDDEPDILALVKTTLEIAGHEVHTAENGEQALAAIAARRFDVLVLDIMMPKVDGYEVLARLADMPEARNLPVIVVTAKHDPAGMLREVRGGAADHVAKPFLPSELEGAVERALHGTATERDERRRVLENEAQVYGSINELFDEIRSDEST